MRELLKRLIRYVKGFLKKKLHYTSEDLPYYVTLIIALIIFGVGLKLFIELADELAENELEGFDSSITEYVLSFRNDLLTAFFNVVTDLGDRYAYITVIIALGLYFWFRKRNWKFTAQMVSVLILATLSNVALKSVINRARPSIEHLVAVNTLSFPSGHSMSAMAFYGFLIYLCLRSSLAIRAKSFISTFLMLLILSIGTSRIYLGVHYPSDVAAGLMGGMIWVAMCAITLNVIELWRKKKTQAHPAL